MKVIDIADYKKNIIDWDEIDLVNLSIIREAYFTKLSKHDQKTFDYLYSILEKKKTAQDFSGTVCVDALDFANKNKFVKRETEDETLEAVFEAFRSLGSHSSFLQYRGGVEVLAGWFDSVKINTRTKEITLTMGEEFAKYQYYLFESFREV